MVFAVPDSPRFQSWCIVFTLSCVCVASHASLKIDSDVSKWVLAAICISLVLSLSSIVSYMTILEKFQGRVESVTASFLVIFWTASLPSIMDPNNSVAITTANFAIVNANLYFFSWAAFGYSLFIFTDVVSEIVHRDVPKRDPKILKWLGLLVSSIIVLASSSQYRSASCLNKFAGVSTCQRTSYAISVGAIGLVIPGIVLALMMSKSKNMSLKLELGISSLMFLLYTFAVGFVTFGDGPASKGVSNLYFSTWVGFALSLAVSFDSFKEFMESQAVDKAEEKDIDAAPAPIIENFEEVEARLDEPRQEQARQEKIWLEQPGDEDDSVYTNTRRDDEETEV